MMAKISKSNIYAIKYLVSQGHEADFISSEINLSIDTIQSIIESENLVKKPPTSKDLMINKTLVKKQNNVSIMTPEASMLNDHNKTRHTKTDNKNHIFNPFNK
jgi:hypothetical protein